MVISHAPLISYGDIPRPDTDTLSMLPEPGFTVEQIHDVLERYFQYVSPTYKFLHHPTVKRWASAYVVQDRQLTAAQKAVVLLVCAQTLLHSPISPGVTQVGKGDVGMSMVSLSSCVSPSQLLKLTTQSSPCTTEKQTSRSCQLLELHSGRLGGSALTFRALITITIFPLTMQTQAC